MYVTFCTTRTLLHVSQSLMDNVLHVAIHRDDPSLASSSRCKDHTNALATMTSRG